MVKESNVTINLYRNYFRYAEISFDSRKGIMSIDFVYPTFVEFDSCESENILSKKSKIKESL